MTRKTSNLASSAHLWEHVHVVYEFYLRRSVVESLAKRLGAAATGRRISMRCWTDDARPDGAARGLAAGRSPDEHEGDDGEDVCRIVDRVSRSVNGVTGIPTGIPELDRMTGGWQPGNLILRRDGRDWARRSWG